MNTKGVQYYKNLIAELKKNDIIPLVTLYHWDLPQTLQDEGGFLNSSMMEWFAEYAEVAFKLFGDDVKHWITFNEPIVVCEFGYGSGGAAPRINGSGTKDYICGHNLIKAHAAAWHVYDKQFRKKQDGEYQ